MTRTPLAIFLALFAAACAGDKDDSLLHATCDNLDERGLDDRLDDLVTNNTEVLDLDGPCGGFNLQWAFASGYLAGSGTGLAVE